MLTLYQIHVQSSSGHQQEASLKIKATEGVSILE